MLKQLLLNFLCVAVCAFTTNAQATLVLVNSPGNIAGSYDFTNSFTTDGWGADPSTGTWTGDAGLVDDGIDPNSDACTPVMNDLTDKIALVDRGACNFSLKAYHAQEAGAIACVIINNEAGNQLFGMLAGDSATAVNIPVVFVTLETGDLIKTELANGSVNMTIGSVVFANDIGATDQDVLRAPVGTMPTNQYEAMASPIPFTPGVRITNNGLNDATNIALTATIDHSPVSGGSSVNVYTDAASTDLLMVDSSIILDMPDYVADAGGGVYTVHYSMVADSTDGLQTDNDHSFQYVLSNNLYAKSDWDYTEGRPSFTGGFGTGSPGAIEFIAGFYMPLGSGLVLDSVYFYAAVNAPSNMGAIGASNLSAYVYEWDDLNADQDISNDEITIVAIGLVESFQDETATAEWSRVKLVDYEELTGDYIIPGDDKVYLVGVRYSGDTEAVFFGFDQDYANDIYADFIAPTLVDLPYFFAQTWQNLAPDFDAGVSIFNNSWAALATGLVVNPVGNSIGKVNPEIGSFEIFPNPVSDFVNVETKLAKHFDKVDYTIVNNNGAIVSSVTRDVNGNVDNAVLDVSELSAGQYFLHVNTVDGGISKGFTIQR